MDQTQKHQKILHHRRPMEWDTQTAREGVEPGSSDTVILMASTPRAVRALPRASPPYRGHLCVHAPRSVDRRGMRSVQHPRVMRRFASWTEKHGLYQTETRAAIRCSGVR